MTSGPIVLIDGVCNLCNGAVRFVVKRDPEARFRFAALQSATGQRLLEQHGLGENPPDSMVLIDKGAAYTRSDAALRIARGLKSPWRLLWAFRVIPRPLRDWAYDFIARHRYRWFGKQDTCMVPTGDLAMRFLD